MAQVTDLTIDPQGPEPLTVFQSDGELRIEADVDPLSVEFAAAGIPGRDGIDGVDGTDGSGAAIEWSPPSAQAVWTIAHNLNRIPSVSVSLPDGEVVGCRVRHLDLNTASIEFAAATSGTATLF